MKNIKVDFFKIFIVASLSLFLFLFYDFVKKKSDNGRYLLIDKSSGYGVIDSRTGIIYRIDNSGNIEKVNDYIPENMDKSAP